MYTTYFILLIITLIIIIPVLGWSLFLLPFAIVFNVILSSLSVRIVRPNTEIHVYFLWKYKRTLKSGLHFIVPIVEKTDSQSISEKSWIKTKKERKNSKVHTKDSWDKMNAYEKFKNAISK